MFKSKYSTVLTVVLIIAIILIVVILSVVLVQHFNNKKREDKNLGAIAEFDSSILNDTLNNTVVNETTGNETVNNELIDSSNVIIERPGNNDNTSQTSKKKYYEGFSMIGYIEIPKTGLKSPILEEVTEAALETSVAVLWPTNNIKLNEPGNVVIVGHNYRNGMFFSDNEKLKVGDKIKITDIKGTTLTYTIYEIFETTPEDTEFITRDTGANTEISLSTCTDDGSRRLIILAKVK